MLPPTAQFFTGPEIVKQWQDTKDLCETEGFAQGKSPAAKGLAAH